MILFLFCKQLNFFDSICINITSICINWLGWLKDAIDLKKGLVQIYMICFTKTNNIYAFSYIESGGWYTCNCLKIGAILRVFILIHIKYHIWESWIWDIVCFDQTMVYSHCYLSFLLFHWDVFVSILLEPFRGNYDITCRLSDSNCSACICS